MMIEEIRFVLEKLKDRTGNNYTCRTWKRYNRKRIYISKDGLGLGYIDVDSKYYWTSTFDYPLDQAVDKFLKYYGKNRETLLDDVKKALDKVQEKDNRDVIYTAERVEDEIVVTVTSWHIQDEGIKLGKIDLSDFSYEFECLDKPWQVQYEAFSTIFYVEILSKLRLYEEENSIKNLDW